jgi:hypothetical protein
MPFRFHLCRGDARTSKEKVSESSELAAVYHMTMYSHRTPIKRDTLSSHQASESLCRSRPPEGVRVSAV